MCPPVADAPMVVPDPKQIEVAVPAAATGNGLTVITIVVLTLLLQFDVVFLASA